MVELVDTYALGAYALRCAGSNPVPGTIIAKEVYGVCKTKICQQQINQL